jgi:hypothetical protein
MQWRWLDKINDFDLKIVYKEGKGNVLADALSRKPDLEVLDTSLVQPSHTEREQLIEGYRNDHQLATVYSALANPV